MGNYSIGRSENVREEKIQRNFTEVEKKQMKLCDCCKEERGYILKGSLRLCSTCSKIPYEKVESLVVERRNKEIDKALSELVNV